MRQIKVGLAALAVLAALALGSAGPAAAQDPVCDVAPDSALCGTDVNVCKLLSFCPAPEPIDLNYICAAPEGPCVSGLENNVNYLVEEAGMTVSEAVATVQTTVWSLYATVIGTVNPIITPPISYLRGVAEGTVAEVQRLVDEGVCVAPFDPYQPICVYP